MFSESYRTVYGLVIDINWRLQVGLGAVLSHKASVRSYTRTFITLFSYQAVCKVTDCDKFRTTRLTHSENRIYSEDKQEKLSKQFKLTIIKQAGFDFSLKPFIWRTFVVIKTFMAFAKGANVSDLEFSLTEMNSFRLFLNHFVAGGTDREFGRFRFNLSRISMRNGNCRQLTTASNLIAWTSR